MRKDCISERKKQKWWDGIEETKDRILSSYSHQTRLNSINCVRAFAAVSVKSLQQEGGCSNHLPMMTRCRLFQSLHLEMSVQFFKFVWIVNQDQHSVPLAASMSHHCGHVARFFHALADQHKCFANLPFFDSTMTIWLAIP